MAIRILRLPEVQARTGLSRSSIYLRLSNIDDAFPKSVSLGARAVGWVESEIEDFLAQQIKQSRDPEK